MAVNISPAMRVEQYPDEFTVKNKQLWCIWCDRAINHKRRDLMNEHLWSKVHQDRRVAGGARMSYDISSDEAQERRRRRRQSQAKSFARKNSRPSSEQQNISIAGSDDIFEAYEDDHDVSSDLRHIFQDSDSNSSTSFEGFDLPHSEDPALNGQKRKSDSLLESTEDEDSRRSGRARKRPAKLSESLGNEEIAKIGKIADQAAFVSSMARRKKEEASQSSADDSSSSDAESSPPARIRSMPIKKQISYSARRSDSLSPVMSPPRGSLKMKFSRKPNNEGSEEYVPKTKKNIKVVTGSQKGDGLKLKFVWKKRRSMSSEKSGQAQGSGTQEPSGYEEMLKNMTEEVNETNEAAQNVEEVIEEEIVEMKEDEVVVDDDWVPPENVQDDQDASAEVRSTPKSTIKTQKVVTERSATKTPAKSKPVMKKTKKVMPDDKKRKMTGYMMWAKQMREKVSAQYPGLEFGDVSKKLGDLWKKIPDKEKQMWKFRNMKMEKQSHMGTIRKSGSRMIETGPRKKPPPPKAQLQASSPPVKNPEAMMQRELARLPHPSHNPIDSAAYFSLLGESFAKLSSKTKKLETKAVIQGAESILLDSLLCALGPLLMLTTQIPQLQGALDQDKLKETLCNIAHIMPGL